MRGEVTVYVRTGDPTSAALTQYLDSRGVGYISRDVDSDPSAQAVLFGRFGRVVAPVTQVGDLMLPGFDALQLSRLLPRLPPAGQQVSFGAAVRTVSADVARAAGLAAAFGVEVGPVRAGSAAADAGISAGDVISAIGPYTLTGGREQFATAVAARVPGDTMTLTVNRQGAELVVAVVFPEVKPEPPAHAEGGDVPAGGSDPA